MSSWFVSLESCESPPGFLTVKGSREMNCQGFEFAPTLILEYNISSGLQNQQSPGQQYGGKIFIAYLPYIRESLELLKRLRNAFRRGLVFSVDGNQLAWNDIPHKTQLTSGDFGWPDPNYFAQVNSILDHLGVPNAFDLVS
jgi:hypothetical protein